MPSLHPSEISKRLGTIKKPLPVRGKPGSLSVCMIVKNEEANIARAIESFLPFADEIVVNDTGSTDRTLEILAKYPQVRVLQSEWIGDFSYSRNLSLDAARCSWVLWMDADDYVPPEQVEQFLKLKTAPLDRAFGFQVINTQGGLPIGVRFTQTRMFPNHPRLRFERKVHEQIIYALAGLGLHIFYLETAIWHMGYEDPAVTRAKAVRNLNLLQDDADRGVDPIVSMQIADSYSILERWGEAVQVYQEALAVPHLKEINPDIFKALPVTIGRCLQRQGLWDSALEWLARGLAEDPANGEALFYKAEILLAQQKGEEARPVLHQVLSLPPKASSIGSQYDVLRMYAHKYLCDLALPSQNFAGLMEQAQAFLRDYPQVVEARVFLGKALLGLGNALGAIQQLEEAVRSNPTASREAWLVLQAAYERAQDAPRLAEVRSRMAKAFGTPAEPVPAAAGLLSVCMIVKNEEKNLDACLASIAGLWDDLVIVDTGSTDTTVAIAESHGARVFHFPWIGDFSAARNRSLEEAKAANILWLDADDRMLPADSARLRTLLQREGGKALGLLVKNSCDGGATGSVFNQIRVFPNGKGVRFSGRVHEQLLDSLRAQGIPVEFKDIRVLHTGYSDAATVAQKQQRNLDILLEEFSANPAQVSSAKLYSIAGGYCDLGKFEEARGWYQKSLERAESRGEDPHIRSIAPVRIAMCHADSGQLELALHQIEAYVQRQPLNPEALALQGRLLESLQRLPEAALVYGRVFHFLEVPTFVPVDFQQNRIRACRMLGAFWAQRGNQPLGIEILRMGVALGRGEEVAPIKLASLYFDHEEYAYARDSLEFGIQLQDSALLRVNLAKVQIMTESASIPLKFLQESCQKYPQNGELAELLQILRADLGNSVH